MISLRTTSCLIALSLAEACSNDCPEGQVPAGDRQGTRQQCLAAASTGETSSTTDPSGTTTAESSTTGESESSTTETPPCDDDPACGPDESLETCPEQCSVCGDGILSGTEACDNGPDNQTYWPTTPPADACSEECTTTFEWCGDTIIGDNEACDNGTNTDPPYSNIPPPDACAQSCVIPGFCGDATPNGPEPCDDAAQTATCELTCVTPTCGDGTHNPQAGEACDDANTQDGDGCTADCKAIERFAFVSSAQYKGDFTPMIDNPGALAGLELADARCQQLASAANLPGNYKAWLSTSDESPTTRFDTRYTGLYRLRSDGAPIVAMAWQGLTSGTLLHAIDADENGSNLQENVWTNTLPDGTKASDTHCSAWTVNDDTTTIVGKSSTTDATWTNLGAGQFCSDPRRLYCFEDL